MFSRDVAESFVPTRRHFGSNADDNPTITSSVPRSLPSIGPASRGG
jgi:hypothetical protein